MCHYNQVLISAGEEDFVLEVSLSELNKSFHDRTSLIAIMLNTPMGFWTPTTNTGANLG